MLQCTLICLGLFFVGCSLGDGFSYVTVRRTANLFAYQSLTPPVPLHINRFLCCFTRPPLSSSSSLCRRLEEGSTSCRRVQTDLTSLTWDRHRVCYSRLSSFSQYPAENMSGVRLILVAGGVGKRMKSTTPKQYLELLGKPVIAYSIDLFRSVPSLDTIVIVADEKYHQQLREIAENDPRVIFGTPGKERYQSVINGLEVLPSKSAVSTGLDSTEEVIAVHDAARPCVTLKEFFDVVNDARKYGAATLAVHVGPTIKQSDDKGEFVKRTLNRDTLWNIQTPQAIKRDLLERGFGIVQTDTGERRRRRTNILSSDLASTVTDDVSVVERMGLPVKITRGNFTNIKITTLDDLLVASSFLKNRVRN